MIKVELQYRVWKEINITATKVQIQVPVHSDVYVNDTATQPTEGWLLQPQKIYQFEKLNGKLWIKSDIHDSYILYEELT